MVAGCSALLRPSPAPLVRVAVLGFLALAVAPPLATAASHSPDPSPAGGLLAPDPSPAPASPAQHTTEVHITTVPVHVQRLAVTAAPRGDRTAPVARPKPRKAVTHSSQAVEPARIPRHAAPQLAALAQTAVASPQRVSRRLVLALGFLVLLSASLVAGAARELAR